MFGEIAVGANAFQQGRIAAIAHGDHARQPALQVQLLEPIRSHLRRSQAIRQARAASTKVDFFTVARESGADTDEDDE